MLREIENEARDMEVIPARELNGLYICLDVLFRAMLGELLLQKRRMTFLFGLFGGVLYFAVDYGVCYLALGTRQVIGANLALLPLWLSSRRRSARTTPSGAYLA